MFLVYDAVTGALVSSGTVLADPLPEGLQFVEVADVDFATQQWDAETRTLVARPPVAIRSIDKSEFLRRLTLTTLAQALALEGTDPQIAALRMWIDNVSKIDLDTPEVQLGIGYLQQLGLVTAQHAADILANG